MRIPPVHSSFFAASCIPPPTPGRIAEGRKVQGTITCISSHENPLAYASSAYLILLYGSGIPSRLLAPPRRTPSASVRTFRARRLPREHHQSGINHHKRSARLLFAGAGLQTRAFLKYSGAHTCTLEPRRLSALFPFSKRRKSFCYFATAWVLVRHHFPLLPLHHDFPLFAAHKRERHHRPFLDIQHQRWPKTSDTNTAFMPHARIHQSRRPAVQQLRTQRL